MKQILQNLKTGEIELAEIPVSKPGTGQVLIQSRASLISPGTERMLVEFAQANLLDKARQQPERVKQALDKIKTDGLMPTLEAIFRKLDEPMPLGYCNAGVVLEVGKGVTDLAPDDRVVSNGPHAEIVCVPRNLCAKIPPEVSDEEAAFTVLASVALQGVRLVKPELGERFLLIGVGPLGLLAIQFLKASGCEVMAVDINAGRLEKARALGAFVVNSSVNDVIQSALSWTGEKGVDGVLITASAETDEIVHQAAQACRKRGRIILIGVVGLKLSRADFYEKEITFQVSCSYGPGRYDEKYERAGQDYPFGFVRWTEQRNFEAVLEAIKEKRLRLGELITDRFEFANARTAYDKVKNDPSSLGIILNYPREVERAGVVQTAVPKTAGAGKAVVSLIGAGNFARGILASALAKTGARLAFICDPVGTAAVQLGKKYGFEKAVSDHRVLLDDPSVNTVFIAVPHNLHARLVCEALQAGKNVCVEKPLCLNQSELGEIINVYCGRQSAVGGQLLLVGFNRRFSPHTIKIKDLLKGRIEPLSMSMTINAGAIPASSWIQDPARGGGRIIGEGCHFIDLLSFIAGSPVQSVSAVMMGEKTAVRDDKVAIILSFADGSVGTVNYFANGAKSYPKEILEIFNEGRVLRMENFRVTRGYGFKGFRKFKTFRQDKGHSVEIGAFIARAESGGAPLIAFDELVNVTRATFAALESAQTGKIIKIS